MKCDDPIVENPDPPSDVVKCICGCSFNDHHFNISVGILFMCKNCNQNCFVKMNEYRKKKGIRIP